MKGKNLERVCIGCGILKPKNTLLRFVLTSDGIIFDPSGKTEGRGAYICDNEECISAVIRRKSFRKSFHGKDSEQIYETLKTIHG